MSIPSPSVPLYGRAALADLVPSLMSALDVPGFTNPLDVGAVSRVCLLLVDGLGWDLLLAHADEAPFLNALARAGGSPLTAGFPATTASSVGSIGTGLAPGEHGLVGYTIAIPGHERPLNSLLWELYGTGPKLDLREECVPEQFQPERTAFERAAADGVQVVQIGPRHHARSGMTRAVLRGGRFVPAFSLGDLAAETVRALATGERTFVYSYHADLDTTGHLRGAPSDAWRYQLAHIDTLAERIASALARRSALVITGDHGMVNLTKEQRLDLDDHPDLAAGVRFLGGECRARHVYTALGAEEDVLAAWRSVLGDRMWVLTRDETIAAGWFGPRVPDRVRPRIGDVVAAAFGPVGIVQRSVDPLQASYPGHHGSMTPAEQLVPLLLAKR